MASNEKGKDQFADNSLFLADRKALHEKMKKIAADSAHESSTSLSSSNYPEEKKDSDGPPPRKIIKPQKAGVTFAGVPERAVDTAPKDPSRTTGILRNTPKTARKDPKDAEAIRASLREANNRISSAKLTTQKSFKSLRFIDTTDREEDPWGVEELEHRPNVLVRGAKSLRAFSRRNLNVDDDDDDDKVGHPSVETGMKSFARRNPGFRDSMQMAGGSVSFYKPRVAEHFERSFTTEKVSVVAPLKKGVSFSMVRIREYPYVIGDSPSVSTGPPLSIGWESENTVEVTLDEHEHIRIPDRRNLAELKVPSNVRMEMLSKSGFSTREIVQGTKMASKTKMERLETKQTLYLAGKQERSEKIKRAILNCFTGRKRAEREYMERAMSFSH